MNKLDFTSFGKSPTEKKSNVLSKKILNMKGASKKLLNDFHKGMLRD